MSVSSPESDAPQRTDVGRLDADVRAGRQGELDRVVAVMAEAVAADGGTLTVVGADVATGVVTVELAGACSSCALSSATLEDGVERILRQRLDWVTEVRYQVAAVVGDDWATSAAMGRGSWAPADQGAGDEGKDAGKADQDH